MSRTGGKEKEADGAVAEGRVAAFAEVVQRLPVEWQGAFGCDRK